MKRNILLLEPNFKNKYPPMGLMKLATYYRMQGDNVRFFKGDLKVLAAQLLCEEYLKYVNDPRLGKYVPKITKYIRTGKLNLLESTPLQNFELIRHYRRRFQLDEFPQFDVVCVTTLFTFYWTETINTINFAKKFCSKAGQVLVGGIAASILPDEIYRETGIMPICGLLRRPGILDNDNAVIIDDLPLDYSILEEIDYEYPAKDAYLAYMTRGCIRRCDFCAVPVLEPEYKDYIGLKEQIQSATKRFGPKKDLLLMDNNVLASTQFDRIIDEIKECGFARDATYLPESEYDIALKNLKEGYNVRAYTRKLISLYDQITEKLPEAQQADFYLERESRGLLYAEVATRDALLEFDETVRPLYDRYFKVRKRTRFVDFNQGVDARLITEQKMKKLAEINIRPLRIAFDHYSMKDIYIAAVRAAAKYGITHLSNYLLYNHDDKPDELYYRMKINIDLCEELGVKIYSFPMKYHPIDDPEYFRSRDYIGKHWNKKFLRAIRAVLNSTKGKIGQGRSFFEEAFGSDIEEFHRILWMPEAFIIYRMKYKDNLTAEWWRKYSSLSSNQLEELQSIVAANRFNDPSILTGDPAVDCVLEYYLIRDK